MEIPKGEDPRKYAVMTLNEGEEIAGMYVTQHVASVGIYKLLIKKRKDKKFEWAHFVERDSGNKENVYRGELEKQQQIETLLTALNNALKTAYGETVKMMAAATAFKTLEGKEFDPNEN